MNSYKESAEYRWMIIRSTLSYYSIQYSI